jgi:hypothetical protein
MFSIFGKKPQSDDTAGEKGTPEQAQRSVPPQPEDGAMRQSDSMKSRRDAARKTAEKIDAIESEITRDILKTPARRSGDVSDAAKGLPNDDTDGDYPSSNLFHTTLIRVDRETLIMFKEDMDE